MKKILLIFILVAVMLFVFPQKLSAQIVINEFSSATSNDDWVEIYNTSDQSVDLSQYSLIDGSTSGNTKIFSCVLAANGFTVVSWGGNLNNGGDIIKLRNGSNIVDCVAYGDGANQKCDGKSTVDISPLSSGEFGVRTSDGSSPWSKSSSSTKDGPNDGSQKNPGAICVIPTPIPTPTNTPISTSSPSPTQTTSKAIYKINKPKDDAGLELTSVQIYVDGQYIHHVDDEILEFYSGNECYLGVSCSFGNHTISLRKNGYSNWEDTRDFLAGVSFEVGPVLDKQTTVSSTPSPSPSATPTKTSTPIPTKTPIPTPTNSPVEEILGAETIFPSQSPGGIQDTSSENIKNTFPFLAVGIIALGLGFMGFSVFSIIKSIKKSYTIESEKENNQIS